MKLIINTIQNPISICLMDGKEKVTEDSWIKNKNESDLVLKHIANKVDLKLIDSISVFSGYGSYTSTRIGVSIANALAYSLNLPISSILLRDDEIIEQNNCSHNRSDFEPILPSYSNNPY